jgi:uncharacterized protein
MNSFLRTFWSRFIVFNWKFGIFLIVILCVPRFILVLNANATSNYTYIGLIMAISASVPFIFLNKEGLRNIGLVKPSNYIWLPASFFTGLFFSFLLYFLGQGLFGHSYENWYQYIGKSYNITPGLSHHNKVILFSVTAITSMIFSPIGEELFFRGIVHASFRQSAGDLKASVADSSAFGLTHISHFGLVFLNGHWHFFAFAAIIWVVSMFLAGIMFFFFKRKTSSLLGSILCHAGFNLGMVFCIFFLVYG